MLSLLKTTTTNKTNQFTQQVVNANFESKIQAICNAHFTTTTNNKTAKTTLHKNAYKLKINDNATTVQVCLSDELYNALSDVKARINDLKSNNTTNVNSKLLLNRLSKLYNFYFNIIVKTGNTYLKNMWVNHYNKNMYGALCNRLTYVIVTNTTGKKSNLNVNIKGNKVTKQDIINLMSDDNTSDFKAAIKTIQSNANDLFALNANAQIQNNDSDIKIKIPTALKKSVNALSKLLFNLSQYQNEVLQQQIYINKAEFYKQLLSYGTHNPTANTSAAIEKSTLAYSYLIQDCITEHINNNEYLHNLFIKK